MIPSKVFFRRVRLGVRTGPSQGSNTGSIPVRATEREIAISLFLFILELILFTINRLRFNIFDNYQSIR